MARGEKSLNPLGPIRKMQVENFTVFRGCHDFDFSPGLNVIIGTNGAGKSHLLKLAYASSRVLYAGLRGGASRRGLKGKGLDTELAEKLVAVFQPDHLGRLPTRSHGHRRASVTIEWQSEVLGYHFSNKSQHRVELAKEPSQRPDSLEGGPIFLPTRDIMTMHPGIIDLYEQADLGLDETYLDLSKALLGPVKRGPRVEKAASLMDPLEKALGGTIRPDQSSGRFYFRRFAGEETSSAWLEMPLLAEGVRKLGMLLYLIANGSLVQHGTVFWDEPETNLNPTLQKAVAVALDELAARGVQVFVATHSAYLMKEFALLERARKAGKGRSAAARYFCFGLADSEAVEVRRTDDFGALLGIASIEAEIEQDDRADALYWQERR